MKFNKVFSVCFIFIVAFSGCGYNTSVNTEKILSKLIDKFPELKKGTGAITDYYKFDRSLTLAEPEIQIQLFKPNSKAADSQEIIVLSNAKGVYYAIPLLNNEYKSYWNFAFDTISKIDHPVNTTFEKEINKAFDTLQINRHNKGYIIDELLGSVLHYQRISDADLENINGRIINNETDLPNDNTDKCNKRNDLNYQSISSLMHPRKHVVDRNAYWDEENNRIYQIELNETHTNVKSFYKIIVYRQGCVVHPLKM